MASYLETMAAQHVEMERQRVLSQKYREADAARRAEETRGFRAAIEARWAAEAERQRKADEARLSADRAATAKLIAQQQRQAEAQQQAQTTWSDRRKELEGTVQELRSLLGAASGRMENSPLEEATRAAGEKSVFAARLAVAERALAQHVQAQPRFFA